MAIELDLQDLVAAQGRIRQGIVETPLNESEALGERLGLAQFDTIAQELNTALDGVRRRSVRRRGEPFVKEVLHPQRVTRPDEHVERKQANARLYDAIERLEPVDRALVLLLLEERSYQEMSEILGMGVSAVGVRLHRAKKKLGQWLSEAA